MQQWLVGGALIRGADGVLLVQNRRRNGRHDWSPPGGVIDHGETLLEGLTREVVEETGVQVTVDGLTGVYKNMNRGIVALVYRCSVEAGHPRTSSETTSVRWVDRDQIDVLMSPAYAARIHDAFNPTTASRAHDGVNLIGPS
jgi:ADP-ribose pyrophosphatase YjhB (NUDIX family)